MLPSMPPSSARSCDAGSLATLCTTWRSTAVLGIISQEELCARYVLSCCYDVELVRYGCRTAGRLTFLGEQALTNFQPPRAEPSARSTPLPPLSKPSTSQHRGCNLTWSDCAILTFSLAAQENRHGTIARARRPTARGAAEAALTGILRADLPSFSGALDLRLRLDFVGLVMHDFGEGGRLDVRPGVG